MDAQQDASGTEIEQTKAPTGSSKLLSVKVYSPFHVYYDGEVDSISAENETGPFDVLLGHRNFLTLLKPCELVIRKAGMDDEKIAITRGLMHVKSNAAIVFLDV